jgi:importin subunit beta-1
VQGLRSAQAQDLCTISVGVVVDICTAVADAIQPFCDQIMEALQTTLSNPHVARDIKPAVIACFGDIAMAIAGAYEPYLQVSSMMLMQASQQCMTCPDDEELLYFINNLRLSILEAYSGIIIGLADGNKLHLFMANVAPIFQFLQYLASAESEKDDRVLGKAVALVGDIVQQMAPHSPELKGQLNQAWIAQLIQEASSVPDDDARQSANWTRGVVQAAMQS